MVYQHMRVTWQSREHMYSIDAVARRIAVFDHMLYYANRTTVSSNERDVIVAWSTKVRSEVLNHIFSTVFTYSSNIVPLSCER